MQVVQASLQKRLDRHVLACAAVAAAGVTGIAATQSDAAVVYSGALNLAVDPTTPAGAYVRVQDFNITFANTIANNLNPGWNLNVFNITYTGNYTGVSFYPRVAATDKAVGTATGIVNKLAASTVVGPASPIMTVNGNGLGAFQVFYPDGTDFGLPWQDDSSVGFMGFRVTFPDASVHFGWLRARIDPWNPLLGTSGAAPVTIIDMAYESTANATITTGVIPEPASAIALGLLAMGAAGIRPKRRCEA
ncbi:hypothetical protein BH09PLA1_BH09PLA1_23550 [soil metagenome]